MAIRKVCGIETEYGIQVRGADSNPVAASSILINAYIATLELNRWCVRGIVTPQDDSASRALAVGKRFAWTLDWDELVRAWEHAQLLRSEEGRERAERIAAAYRELTSSEIRSAAPKPVPRSD